MAPECLRRTQLSEVGWLPLKENHRVVGRIVSEVRVSASFQIFALRMMLHSAGNFLGGGVISDGVRREVILPPGIGEANLG